MNEVRVRRSLAVLWLSIIAACRGVPVAHWDEQTIAERFAGCYRVMPTPGMVLEIPATVTLSSEPLAKVVESPRAHSMPDLLGRKLYYTPGIQGGAQQELLGYWFPQSSDEVAVVWTNGLVGWMLSAHRTVGGLEGTLERLTDRVGDSAAPAADVRLSACALP